MNISVRVAFALVLTAAALVCYPLATQIDIDYFDSYRFFLQSRRLAPFDFGDRPRTPVMILAVFEAFTRLLTGRFPSLSAYHLLNLSLSLAYVAVWGHAIARLTSPLVGALTGVLLLTQQLFVHYAVFGLHDMTAGLAWGMTFLLILRAIELPALSRNALVLGFFGALTTLAKHTLFWLFPAAVLLMALWYRDRRRWLAVALIAWAVSADLLCRAFGDWSTGLLGTIANIFAFGRKSLGVPTSPWTYAENLPLIFGPLFLVLALVAVAQARPRSQDRRVWLLGVLTLLFTLQVQLIPHREVRYLLPFLPAWLGAVAWCLVRAAEPWSRSRRLAWSALWVLAILHPAHRSFLEWRQLRTDAAYRRGAAGFWAALEGCPQIAACDFEWRPRPSPTELKHDPYFNVFNVGPQYAFHTGTPAQIYACRPGQMPIPPQPDWCYVLVVEKQPSLAYPPQLLVLRPGKEPRRFFAPPVDKMRNFRETTPDGYSLKTGPGLGDVETSAGDSARTRPPRDVQSPAGE